MRMGCFCLLDNSLGNMICILAKMENCSRKLTCLNLDRKEHQFSFRCKLNNSECNTYNPLKLYSMSTSGHILADILMIKGGKERENGLVPESIARKNVATRCFL